MCLPFFSFLLCIRELVCVSLFDTKMMSLFNQINNEMSIYVYLAGSLHFEHLWKQLFDFFSTPLDKISILVILLTKCVSQKKIMQRMRLSYITFYYVF